jgi:hypothetical protein
MPYEISPRFLKEKIPVERVIGGVAGPGAFDPGSAAIILEIKV